MKHLKNEPPPPPKGLRITSGSLSKIHVLGYRTKIVIVCLGGNHERDSSVYTRVVHCKIVYDSEKVEGIKVPIRSVSSEPGTLVQWDSVETPTG
jgi:hypothetical protein